MNKLFCLLILSLMISSCNKIEDKRVIERLDSSFFFKDYDIFARKGMDTMDKNNLILPFIQEYKRDDSLIILRIYTENFESYQCVVLPVNDGYIFKTSFVFSECGGIDYFTIDSNRIIRYNYKDIPYDLIKNETDSMSLYQIVPFSIEIITTDSIKFILYQEFISDKFNSDFNEYGSLSAMKEKFILPFNANIDLNGGFETYGENIYLTKIIEKKSGYFGMEFKMDNRYIENSQVCDKVRIRYWQSFFYPKQFKFWRPYFKLN